MGGDLWTRGGEFESQHRILDLVIDVVREIVLGIAVLDAVLE